MNALQASPPGQTVTIDLRAAGTPSGSQVQIRVVDRGEGMSGDVLERLQRPPFTTRPDGAGLGVAVARTLVEQHGGRLLYESTPGQGTTAIIELPQRQPAREPSPRLVPDALRARSGIG